MNRYAEMRERHQDEFNALPIKFAFSNKQFAECMAEWGLTPNDTDKIYKIDGNGFYLRTDSPKIKEWYERTTREHSDAIDGDTTGEGFIYEMFLYELRNHEYGYTGDTEDTLDALGYTYEDIEKEKRLAVGLQKACEQIQGEEW